MTMNSNNKWAEIIPDEILTTICLCNIPLLPPELCPLRTRRQPTMPPFLRDTISASQVCVRWYNIVTSTPMLWNTSINPHHPRSEWTNLLLNRSNPLPIAFLETKYDDGYTPEMLYREIQYADKLSQYCLSFKDPWHIPEKFIPRHWPHLSFLCLNYSSCFDCYGYIERLPEDIPGPGMPNLTKLHFHTCFVSHPSQLITQFGATLRELRITGLSRPSRISLSTLLSTIQGLPNLKELYLAHTISETDFSVDAQLAPIILHLEILCLGERTPSCLQLMKYIDISRTTEVFTVGCTELYDLNHPESFANLLDHIPPLRTLHRHPALARHSVLALDGESVVVAGLGKTTLNPPHIPRNTWKKLMRDVTHYQYGYLAFASRSDNLPSLFPHLRPLLDSVEIIYMRYSFDTHEFESSELLYSLVALATRVRYIIGMDDIPWALMFEEIMVDTISTQNGRSNHNEIQYLLANLEVLGLVNKELDCLMYEGFEEELIHFCSVIKTRVSPLRYITIYSPYLELPERMIQEVNQLGVDIEVEKIDVRLMFNL